MTKSTLISPDISNIVSLPPETDETGCTMCSKTARINARLFGVLFPMGNAFQALEHPGPTCTGTLPRGKEHELPDSSRDGIPYDEFLKTGENADISDIATCEIPEDSELINKKTGIQLIADIAVDSDTPNGKLFGHRVVAYKRLGEWFVFDPYVKGNNGEGIKLEKYMETHKILKCNFYSSAGYNFVRYEQYTKSGGKILGWGDPEQKMVETFIRLQDDRKTLLLLTKMNNGEPLNIDDRFQLIDDNESDALAKGILNNTSENMQQQELNKLFKIFRGGKRGNKKPVFINMYRILCQKDKKFYDKIINKSIVDYLKEQVKAGKLNYLDIDSYYWLDNSFNFDANETVNKEIHEALKDKYNANVSLECDINGRKLYIEDYHEYFLDSLKQKT